MEPLDLSDNYKLAAGIIMGMAFGFVLVKSDLAWPKSILDALLLRNGRIIKTILLTLAAGAVFFFVTRKVGLTEIQVRPTYLWGSIFGGIICGCGLVLCPMTPTTATASLAGGKFYAVWSILGMMLALPAVSEISYWLSKSIFYWGDRLPEPPAPEVFFSLDNPALYASGITLVLLLLVHFTVGDTEE